MAGAPELSVPRCLASIAGFLVGATLGGRLGVAISGVPRRHWLLMVAIVEAGLFFAAALFALGYDIETLDGGNIRRGCYRCLALVQCETRPAADCHWRVHLYHHRCLRCTPSINTSLASGAHNCRIAWQ